MGQIGVLTAGEGQTAYYPTQKCTWDKKTCGKPGINGGFFSNPYLKFGANCCW